MIPWMLETLGRSGKGLADSPCHGPTLHLSRLFPSCHSSSISAAHEFNSPVCANQSAQ